MLRFVKMYVKPQAEIDARVNFWSAPVILLNP